MRTLDSHLSLRARQTWPGAQVWSTTEDRHAPRYVLERPDHEPVQLGAGGFAEARRALSILREDARD